MKKILPIVLVIFVVVAGLLVWQKSQVKIEPKPEITETGIKMIDLSTQPEWVQRLVVAAKKGSSANGLANFTLSVSGLPQGMVASYTYIVQYETSNKGTQGALAMTPIKVDGVTQFSKTIDLGTCSTKSCVRHDGVSAVEVELDFKTTDGGTPIWTGKVNL